MNKLLILAVLGCVPIRAQTVKKVPKAAPSSKDSAFLPDNTTSATMASLGYDYPCGTPAAIFDKDTDECRFMVTFLSPIKDVKCIQKDNVVTCTWKPIKEAQ